MKPTPTCKGFPLFHVDVSVHLKPCQAWILCNDIRIRNKRSQFVPALMLLNSLICQRDMASAMTLVSMVRAAILPRVESMSLNRESKLAWLHAVASPDVIHQVFRQLVSFFSIRYWVIFCLCVHHDDMGQRTNLHWLVEPTWRFDPRVTSAFIKRVIRSWSGPASARIIQIGLAFTGMKSNAVAIHQDICTMSGQHTPEFHSGFPCPKA